MNLLARLMSHGFSIALVVLLAIGFIYRGELFPEWELPDFLVLDSEDKTSEDQVAGKIEPAPVQDDRMAPGSATPGQDAAEIKEDSISTDDAPGAMQSDVEEVTAPAAETMAEGASIVADTGETVDAPGTDATVPVDAPGTDATVPHVTEESVASDAPAATETGDEPVAVVVQESAEAIAATETPDAGHAVEVAEAVMPATAASDDTGSGAVNSDAGMTPEPVDAMTHAVQDDTGTPPVAVAAEAAGAAPDSAEVAEEVAAPDSAEVAEEVAAPDSAEVVEEVAAPDSTEAAEEAGEPDSVMQDSAPRMPAVSTVSSYQLLASAREAFWLRDYQGAEDQYLQMIQNDPDNPDGYGELANMYFTQGNWEAAASAYYEAGTRLVKSGLLAPASELVDVIRGLNGTQADDLEQEIQMAREASQ
jgi:hypothetical protein